MTAAPTHGPPAAARSPYRLSPAAIAWLIAVGLLPLAELGLLSALFDASAIAERGGWLAHVIGASGDGVRAAPPPPLAGAPGRAGGVVWRAAPPVRVAALLVGAAWFPALAPALRATFASPHRPWAALGGQVACFALV